MRESKTRVKTLILFVLLIFLVSGCFSIKPTYTKEKIVESITLLCKQEYNIEPKVWLLGETVWIYIPLPRLITKDIHFDKEIIEIINKVIMGASRVVLSMKPRPQFMAVVASDIQEYAIDYYLITWIPDIVKFQLQFISRDEFSRRSVTRIEQNLLALHDRTGAHIRKKEIKIGDFLVEQIMQRTHLKFMQEAFFKDYFKVKGISGIFDGDTFKIDIQARQIKILPSLNKIDILKEIAKIAAYVIKEYEFKDFLLVEIKNSATGEESQFTRLDLKRLVASRFPSYSLR